MWREREGGGVGGGDVEGRDGEDELEEEMKCVGAGKKSAEGKIKVGGSEGKEDERIRRRKNEEPRRTPRKSTSTFSRAWGLDCDHEGVAKRETGCILAGKGGRKREDHSYFALV